MRRTAALSALTALVLAAAPAAADEAGQAFNMPIVLSTVGVEMGVNGPTRASIMAELPGIDVIDRSSMNAWEDRAFHAAVKKTGRKRFIFGALYTEICLALPVARIRRAVPRRPST